MAAVIGWAVHLDMTDDQLATTQIDRRAVKAARLSFDDGADNVALRCASTRSAEETIAIMVKIKLGSSAGASTPTDARELSGGMKKRAGSPAPFRRPKILFYDEPSRGWIGHERGSIRSSSTDQKLQVTSVVVTHEWTARSASATAWCSGSRKFIVSGPPEEMRESRTARAPVRPRADGRTLNHHAAPAVRRRSDGRQRDDAQRD